MSSSDLFNAACDLIPGGVNSPVRAFKGVGGEPIFFSEGKGAYVTDVSGKNYIDYVGSWGPLILGHAHPSVVNAVQKTAEKGLSFGAPTELEIKLAEFVCQLMPNIEKVRMVNSGTEATMTALRLARGITGRDKILKFDGCYHGHSDSLLSNAGSGVLTLGLPSCPGVPKGIAELTVTATFNDLENVSTIMNEIGHEIAAIIVEPVAGNMGCILPKNGFLQGLRDLCDKTGALLIFDEVMTGFRVRLTGAQGLYGVRPCITTLGKVIGGGMPVGAIGGSASIMDNLAPVGAIYQAGTLSGNPIAMAAGLATLNEISQPDFFRTLSQKSEKLVSGFKEVATRHAIDMTTSVAGAMFGLAFSEKETIETFADIKASQISRFNTFFHGMLAEGVYLAPSAYEAGFVSSAHTDEDIENTIMAADRVLANIANNMSN